MEYAKNTFSMWNSCILNHNRIKHLKLVFELMLHVTLAIEMKPANVLTIKSDVQKTNQKSKLDNFPILDLHVKVLK